MAAPGGKYFIQDKLDKPFEHHKSFKALWETKWKKPCEMGVYPFMFGSIQDFQPVVDELIAKDMKEPYDWDAYAATFFPHAEKLVSRAKSAESEGETEKAAELYLRGSALYRIARFPAPRSEKQNYAWEKGKEAASAGLALHNPPTRSISIPHTHATAGDGPTLPVYYHLPSTTPATLTNGTSNDSNPQCHPLLIIFTGLDGYRTDLAVWIRGWISLGVAVLIAEIPGTGDNPADACDPASPDRVCDSLFDWIAAQSEIDQSKIGVWGFSTGGYYAIRLAHTHKERLCGVASQGGGCHHMFDAEWLEKSNGAEYPFDLGHTLAWKYGYDDFEVFKREASKFSLVEDGTLDRPCSRLLLVNGDEDSIFPVDDMWLAVQRGGPKELRIVKGTAHMGEPEAFFIILKWLFERFDIQGHPGEFMKMIPTKTKF